MTGKRPAPTKLCAACGRPFSWRRKWLRDWDSVRFCSAACRTGRRAAAIGRKGLAGAERLD